MRDLSGGKASVLRSEDPTLTADGVSREDKSSGGAAGRLTVLYGGSFNPLHIGHLAILKALCERNDVERVLLSVSPRNPLKETPASESAEARLDAARQALARHPELTKVVVSDIELRLPPPSYTIRTLDTRHSLDTLRSPLAADSGRSEAADNMLRASVAGATEPDNYRSRVSGEDNSSGPERGRLCLAIGGDQLADFRRWRDYARILLDYGLLVYPREGFDSPALRADLLRENPAYRITLLDAPEIKISSTQLRSGAVEDKEKYLM